VNKTVHEFAREYWKISNDEYRYWRDLEKNKPKSLNALYNDALQKWKDYGGKNIEDFYLTSDIYSKGTVFKEQEEYRGTSDSCGCFNGDVIKCVGSECETFLDYGCGVGWKTINFYEKGFKVTLADLNTPLFKMIQAYYKFLKYDMKFLVLTDSPLKENYDIIYCEQVLQHTPKADETLKSILSHCNHYIYIGGTGVNKNTIHVQSNSDIINNPVVFNQIINDAGFYETEIGLLYRRKE